MGWGPKALRTRGWGKYRRCTCEMADIDVRDPRRVVVTQNMRNMGRRRKQAQFIRAYRAQPLLSASKLCKLVDISRRELAKWIAKDTLFQLHYAEAKELAQLEVGDALEQELIKRAIVGVDTPLVSMGKVVTVVKRKSDKLLEIALKANLPEKYGNKSGLEVEIGDKDSGKYIKAYVGFNPDDAV